MNHTSHKTIRVLALVTIIFLIFLFFLNKSRFAYIPESETTQPTTTVEESSIEQPALSESTDLDIIGADLDASLEADLAELDNLDVELEAFGDF